MIKSLTPVAALLFSVAFLLMGNGLQGTLLSVRGGMESFSDLSLGLLGSTYFAGYAVGCLLGARLISRVGHIRTFTAMAAIASAVPLIHGLLLSPVPWWIMRIITGFCFAILYIVIESWLNAKSTNQTRGAILSTYLVINLTVMTLGQLMLTLHDPGGFVLFALTSILVSVSAVPVALTATSAPAPIHSSKLKLLSLYKISPVAFVSSLGIGLANGTFWALGPVFARRAGMDIDGIALFMSVVILGGAIGQWPIGRLSDRNDRRIVLCGTSAIAALCGISIYAFGLLTPSTNLTVVLWIAAFWGLSAFPLYAIAIAHANDHASPNDYVGVSSGMLLVFAAGSIVGPVLASGLMGLVGASGIFIFTALVHTLLCGYTVARIKRRTAPPAEDRVKFTDSLVAAQTVSEEFNYESDPGEETIDKTTNEKHRE